MLGKRSGQPPKRIATNFSRDIILTYEAEAQAVTTDAIIKKIFNAVPVP